MFSNRPSGASILVCQYASFVGATTRSSYETTYPDRRRQLTAKRGQSQGGPRDRDSGRPSANPSARSRAPRRHRRHATNDTTGTKKDYYFAFAAEAFSRAPVTMSFNLPFSASTLNKSTTKGT